MHMSFERDSYYILAQFIIVLMIDKKEKSRMEPKLKVSTPRTKGY